MSHDELRRFGIGLAVSVALGVVLWWGVFAILRGWL